MRSDGDAPLIRGREKKGLHSRADNGKRQQYRKKEKQSVIGMTEERVYNFSAGPSVLPESVLRRAQNEMMNCRGSGMSVMEMSHRSAVFSEIFQDLIRI